MKKILATFVFTATSLALLGQGERPNWMDAGYRARQYPTATFYSGSGEKEIVRGKPLDDIKEQAKAAARDDLVGKIVTQVSSIAQRVDTSMLINGKLVESHVFVKETVTKSVAKIPGLVTELPHVDDKAKKVYAFAYVRKQDLIRYYENSVKRGKDEVEELKEDAEALLSVNLNSKAKEKYDQMLSKRAEIKLDIDLLSSFGVGAKDLPTVDKLDKDVTLMREMLKRGELIRQIQEKLEAVETTIKRAKEMSYARAKSAYKAAQGTIAEVEKLQQELRTLNGSAAELQAGRVNDLYIEVERLLKALDRDEELRKYGELVKELAANKQNVERYARAKKRFKAEDERGQAEAKEKKIKEAQRKLRADYRDVSSTELQTDYVGSLMESIKATDNELQYFPMHLLIGYRYSPTAPVGLSLGLCKRWVGFYVHGSYSMFGVKESMVKATYEGEGELRYFRRSYTAGYTCRLRMRRWSAYPYIGAGYGKGGAVYAVEGENKTYHSFDIKKGFELEYEYGVALTYDWFGFSAGYSAIVGSPFKEVHGGVVVKIGKRN